MPKKSIESAWASQWVDDYLDLYNIALKLGDQEWQQQIIGMLQNKEHHIGQELQRSIVERLWSLFDSINRQMLGLYEQLKHSEDQQQTEELRKQVLELKTQRVVISKQLGISAIRERKQG